MEITHNCYVFFRDLQVEHFLQFLFLQCFQSFSGRDKVESNLVLLRDYVYIYTIMQFNTTEDH